MEEKKPWNTCPSCKQPVDINDEVFDGSEVKCHGCEKFLVVVEFEGGSHWELHDAHDGDDEEPDAAATGEGGA